MEKSNFPAWHILLVDDDEEEYLLTREILNKVKGRAITLDWEPTYEAGQERLLSNQYDAVFVDYDLGSHTGIELIRKITARGYRAPLILYTDRGSYEVEVEAMQAGATLYITKSEANSLMLERSIHYAIERKRFEQERQDITEKKKTEGAVLESQQHFCTALENLLDAFEIYSAVRDEAGEIQDFRVEYVNEAACLLTGRKREDYIGKRLLELYPNLHETGIFNLYLQAVEQDVTIIKERFPLDTNLPGGTETRFYDFQIAKLGDGFTAVWREVTEQKRAEEALRFSEELFSKAFNATPDALVISRLADGLVEMINDRFEQLFGYSRAEVIGKTSLQLNWIANLSDRAEVVTRMQSGSSLRGFEMDIRIKSGEIKRAKLSIEKLNIQNENYILTIIEEITGRKEADSALQESELQQRELVKSLEVERARLAAVLDNLPVGVWIADSQGQLIEKNEQADRIWAGDAPLLESIEKYPEYSAWYTESGRALLPEEYPVAKALRTGQPVEPVELNIRRFDGSEGTVLVSAAPIKDREGLVTGVIGVNMDITGHKQAEEALRESDEVLRLALAASGAGAWSWDLSTDTLHWSDEYYRIFGFEPGHIQPSAEAGLSRVHPDDLPRIQAIVQEAMERGTQIDVVHRVIWPDGTVHWVRGISRAFYYGDGKPYRMAGIAMNITEQKQKEVELEAAHRQTAEILESISDAFYSLDQEGRFTYVNQKAASLWGKQPGDLIGKIIWEVFPSGKETESYQKIMQALAVKRPTHYESYSAFLDQWVEIHLYPTEQGISVYFQDITERKRSEAILEVYTKELERSNRDLQEFAFVASHDLQEPLRKIEAFGSLILEEATNLPERQRDQFERMRESAGRMRKMVDGLLQLSRLTTHAQPFQSVDLHQITQEVISDLELLILQTGGVVEVGELPVIQADALQMRQLLQNLIGNALKFQPPGGKPEVKVFSRSLSPDSTQILIHDNGIGFNQERAERIFQPFKRLVGRSEYEGSGIGLAIARKIVERHGGEINVRSKPGHGSEFIVTLPLEQNDSR